MNSLPKINWREFLALLAMFSIGHTSLVIQPLLVGSFVDYKDLSDKLAGFITATEMAGFALASIAIVRWVPVLDRRLLAWTGISIYIIGNLFTIYAGSSESLFVCRALVGTGGGLVMASYNAVIGGSSEPDRMFATVMFAGVMHSALLLFLFPIFIKMGGVSALMLAQIVNALIFTGLITWVPRHPKAEQSRAITKGGSLNISVMFVLLTILLVYAGHSAVWTYQERMGKAISMSPESIGLVLGSASFVGAVGSAMASWMNTRFGRCIPNVVSLVLLVISVIALTNAGNATAFVLWTYLLKIGWFFGIPFLIGLCAVLDPRGQANVLAGFMFPIGSALGPALAAMMVGTAGYAGVGMLSAVCYAVCLLISIPVAFSVDRKLGIFPRAVQKTT